MAITWTVDIRNVNVDQNRADVTFMRTDDLTSATESYHFSKVILETTLQRVALLDLVWQKHLDEVSDQAAIDAFITNLEQLGKANLESREV